MADLTQDSLLSSGGFKATECSGTLTIASGSSGTLATLTSSGGRKIRLTMLFPESGAETGITVTTDGVAVVSSKQLSLSTNSAGSFAVGAFQSGAASFIGNVKYIEANNSIAISKASGATSNSILYATEQGF